MVELASSARRSNIEDVARFAGVSRAAVSKVIRDAYGVSPEMRTKVESAIEQLGYRPRISARGMRGSTYTLGVALPTVNNQFFTQIIAGLTAALGSTRYQLIIAPTQDAGTQALQGLVDRQVDGIVAISPAVEPEWLERLAQGTPLVMLGRHDDSVRYDTVVGDDLEGARLAVAHLHDLGHHDIVHLTVDPRAEGDLATAPHAVRALGYERAMASLGLAARAITVHIDPTESAAFARTCEILQTNPRPTAVFAGHDELALGVLHAVSVLGLGPSELSVVGYDNTAFGAHPLVSLTSIDQSGARMGEIGAQLLLERIAGRAEAVHEVITPHLVSRRSSASAVSEGVSA